MTTAARDDFWDITKAVLMWLVILGHTIQVTAQDSFFAHPLFKAIYLFHLPVFFFISGYFALNTIRKKKWKGLCQTSIRLLLPVLTLGTLQLIFLACRQPLSMNKALNCYICLWFLWSLFECQLSGHLLMAIPYKAIRVIFLFLPIIICVLLRNYIPYADYISFAWPFYILGMFARHMGFNRNHINKNWFWAIIPAAGAFLLYKEHWFIYLSPLRFSAESIFIALFRILAALASGTVFLALMHQCAAMLRIAKLGLATLGIYVVQTVICYMSSRFTYPALFSETWVILPLSFLVFLLSYYTYQVTRLIPFAGTLFYGDTKKQS